jgi:hypothetical protein
MDPSIDEPPRRPPEPGEPRRVLDRPPGERLASREATAEPADETTGASAALRAGALGRALVVGAIGAAVIVILGGPMSLTVGLLAVAAIVGWAVGSYARPSVAIAVTIAVASVVLGLIGIWSYARFLGGVLDVAAYLGEVHGPLLILELATAGVAAALAARTAR